MITVASWKRLRKRFKFLDLFAGPGGWDLGAMAFGLEVLGVEYDDAACATRAEAGLLTLQADVAELDPADFKPLTGFIASPPCPTFSMAGGGGGRKLTDNIEACLDDLARGEDTRQQHRDESFEILEPAYWADEQEKAKRKIGKRGVNREPDREKSAAKARRDADMSILVCEPLRWALAIDPDWIVLEQVETVLDLWRHLGQHLQDAGYYVYVGVLNSEQYGVPQTRRRAILIARKRSLGKPVMMPRPTHRRYVAPQLKRHEKQEGSLFDDASIDVGDRQHITAPGDRHLEPWISMAEALGWGMTARPYPVIASGRSTGGPDKEKVGGSAAREVIYGEQAAGRWHYRNGNQPNAAIRPVDEPAPTLHFGHAMNSGVEWTQTPEEPWKPHAMDQRGQTDGRTGEKARERPIDEPAPTIAGESRNSSWVGERPATTVAGDPRIAEPGHKREETSPDAPGRMTNAVRVTIDEAAILQSFPANYPWQGSQTKIFEQIGNAVPPLLARAVIGEALRYER